MFGMAHAPSPPCVGRVPGMHGEPCRPEAKLKTYGFGLPGTRDRLHELHRSHTARGWCYGVASRGEQTAAGYPLAEVYRRKWVVRFRTCRHPAAQEERTKKRTNATTETDEPEGFAYFLLYVT